MRGKFRTMDDIATMDGVSFKERLWSAADTTWLWFTWIARVFFAYCLLCALTNREAHPAFIPTLSVSKGITEQATLPVHRSRVLPDVTTCGSGTTRALPPYDFRESVK